MREVFHDEISDMNYRQMVKVLCETAKLGLAKYYSNAINNMPYTTNLDKARQWKLNGINHRYAAISQIGIAKWLKFHPEDTACLPNLWLKILNNHHKITHVGDFALWAAIASGVENCECIGKCTEVA